MPVYLARAGEDGPVKIGFSDNVLNRLVKMQTDLPHTLIVLRILDGGKELEAALHARFKLLLQRGEWFTYSEEMLGDLGSVDFLPQKVNRERGPRKQWTPESRANAAAGQLAVQNDPERRRLRNEKMRETQLQKMQLWRISQVVSRVGNWKKLADAVGLPLTEVMAWKLIPLCHAEAVARAANLPVMKLSDLLERNVA